MPLTIIFRFFFFLRFRPPVFVTKLFQNEARILMGGDFAALVSFGLAYSLPTEIFSRAALLSEPFWRAR